ncbi:MAG: DUF6249 domain-containing protein [Terracidiphilus sp.]
MEGGVLIPIMGEMIPIVFLVVLFTFITIATWVGNRRKERDAFYKSETLRRITEAGGEGSKAAMELLREEGRLKLFQGRENLKIGGVVNLGVGIGLVILLRALVSWSVAMCGLIPILVGVGLLVYVYALAAPLEQGEQPAPGRQG